MRTLDELGISPAPWEVDGNEVYCVKWDSSFGMSHKRIVATLNKWDDTDNKNANARLIAAAPMLFEACRECGLALKTIMGWSFLADYTQARIKIRFDKCCSALAAASGESEEGGMK